MKNFKNLLIALLSVTLLIACSEDNENKEAKTSSNFIKVDNDTYNLDKGIYSYSPATPDKGMSAYCHFILYSDGLTVGESENFLSKISGNNGNAFQFIAFTENENIEGEYAFYYSNDNYKYAMHPALEVLKNGKKRNLDYKGEISSQKDKFTSILKIKKLDKNNYKIILDGFWYDYNTKTKLPVELIYTGSITKR